MSKASFPPGPGITKALSVWLEGYLAFRNLSDDRQREALPEEPQKLERNPAPLASLPLQGDDGEFWSKTIGDAILFASAFLESELGVTLKHQVWEKAVTTHHAIEAVTPSGLTFTSTCTNVSSHTHSHIAAICDVLSQVKAKDYWR